MADVVLQHLSKTFPNGTQAVRDLSLQIADGELVVLLGPSGCGKTTTLRLIAGLEEPTSGTVQIGGRVVNALPPRARNVAMVFQKATLYPQMNVRRNLAFGLRMRRGGSGLARLLARWLRLGPSPRVQKEDEQIQQRVADAARLLGLEALLERAPGQLSGGQQQRVALGRALVRQPEVFLLDEPLSQLDSRLRAELRHELHLLQRRLRKTMIYVTHDQAEAMTLADRLVVMDRGLVHQVDRPLAVYERPISRFVAGFLGWPAMNFLEGRLEGCDGEMCFACPSLGVKLNLGAGKAKEWAAHAGHEVTLGIRPEDLLPVSPGRGGLVMQVVMIEALGSACLVTLERQGWQATARFDLRQGVEQQQAIEVCFQMEHAHLFDRQTGIALSSGPRRAGG
ncbi:MAG TPA: ATP-binding cassette domain-containing protein [Gemmataceae bacterium]|nr:ATP-binding cassette domain-containing protein [Gemmataceae bacterium]